MIKKLFFNWHKNKEEGMWMCPPHGGWNKVITDDIIIIDYDGVNLIQRDKKRTIKERWSELLEEADKNLVEEDNASSIIIALIKGYDIRNRYRYI